MALKNSKTGSLPVSEIYNFMTEHFPYFKVSSTGMGRGISLHVYVSTGNKGWDSSCEQRQFLRRLTPNQLHTAYSHDHKLHSILQKCEMWWYWTQKPIKSCSSCELGNVTVTIPHQQPIKRAKNCKNTFTASSEISNTGRTGLVASSATSSSCRLVWKQRIPGYLSPSRDIHLGQQHPVHALRREKWDVC